MQHEKNKKITSNMIQELVKLIFDQGKDGKLVPENKKTELFEEYMEACLSEDLFDRSKLPDSLSTLCSISGISKSGSLKSIISDNTVELKHLVKIKDYFKYLSAHSQDETEHQIFNVIYYVIIACALLFHEKKITKFTYLELKKNYSQLVRQDWLPQYVEKLFQEAWYYCYEENKS